MTITILGLPEAETTLSKGLALEKLGIKASSPVNQSHAHQKSL
jgi:hypothetical protein